MPNAGPLTCTSWEDADNLLAELGSVQGRIARAQADAEARLRPIQEELAAIVAPLHAQETTITAVLERYCDGQRATWGTAKSRKLPSGEVGFRSGKPKLALREGHTWDTVLMAVQEAKKRKLLRTKLELDKGAMADLSEADQERFGVQLVQDETFYAKPSKPKSES